MRRRYALNSDHLASELVEGELVMINFDNGCYYACNEAGASLLAALNEGHSPADLVVHCSAHFAAEQTLVQREFENFVDALMAEQILKLCPATSASAGPVRVTGSQWQAPRLGRYADLQDLLLLDPIHDVAPQGWPQTADQAG